VSTPSGFSHEHVIHVGPTPVPEQLLKNHVRSNNSPEDVARHRPSTAPAPPLCPRETSAVWFCSFGSTPLTFLASVLERSAVQDECLFKMSFRVHGNCSSHGPGVFREPERCSPSMRGTRFGLGLIPRSNRLTDVLQVVRRVPFTPKPSVPRRNPNI